MPHAQLPDDPLWFKDAVIYEAHVRTFYDSNGDGVGDFPGLTRKLDYLRDLGINTLWLLPFYPSPLRDDGYDIADYEAVHPSYGTLRDFRAFLREAHERGIRVITELVINHTSDQHPWFQASRRAAAGSSKRGYYVWSETDRRYPLARVIFTDAEKSNWTWDPEAKAYYWHRFFHHQPDLNFDNPRVRRAVMKTLRFWLDMGVDGLRLDAVPYLIEREGTICENLPETHAILKAIRREVDVNYRNRVLLGEANQWPADVRPYFGAADECHMAYHFPLMPRIFMALKMEERHPIVDILRQTPEIPESCQWALFLRNHDEMTLEMVTDEERDYLYEAYAADPQMRVNIGIRRRLAPLMENNRLRIELLNSLLFSLPGTPVIYYGDEIGMGDNIYLGDRNGVRTPMQWTGDRNAGFSTADPARLYAPVIMDAVYGYQAINVEAQERSPASLLQWMKRMIALRHQHRTFGRGTLEFLAPANRKVLAFVRRFEEETILVVANLSRTAQPAELDLAAFEGLIPVEMLGRAELPRIGDRPYFLTLGPYGFYWFLLQRAVSPVAARPVPPVAEEVEPVPVFFAGVAWNTLLDGHVRTLVERDSLPRFLPLQRWFGAKGRTIRSTRIADWVLVRAGTEPAFLTFVDVEYADEGQAETYFVPMALAAGVEAEAILKEQPALVIARVSGARKGVLYDGLSAPSLCEWMLAALADGRPLDTQGGVLDLHRTSAFAEALGDEPALKAVRLGGDQSNTSIAYGDRLILKFFRRLQTGPNPDVEIGCHLTERIGFTRIPPAAGVLGYRRSDLKPCHLGLLQKLISSQANAWEQAVDELDRFFERADTGGTPDPALVEPDSLLGLPVNDPPHAVHETVAAYLNNGVTLGRRVAELHLALAQDAGDPAFTLEPLETADVARVAAALETDAGRAFAGLERALRDLDETTAAQAARLLERRERVFERIRELGRLPVRAARTRVHGDLHLGQVLWADGDFYILDFEGEPARSIAERRTKQSPLKDVAGMIRSYVYASHVGLFVYARNQAASVERLAPWARVWHVWNSAVFLDAYLKTATGAPFLPADPAHVGPLLDLYQLEKVVYELRYEMDNRPEWVRIPLQGLLALVTVGD